MGNGRSTARSLSVVHSLCPLQSDDTSNARMYEEPLLGGASGKSSPAAHAQHLQQYLYASDDAGSKKPLPTAHDALDLHISIHQLNSFFAVLWPVCITMICTSLAVCHVHDANMKHAMAAYMYYQDIDTSSDSIGHKSLLAFCNALLVIGFIACLTCGVVLLYKFNCMQFFLGYCVFYSTTLLGFAGAKIIVLVLCDAWHWRVDLLSLVFVMYNFAVVGVLSIFYQRGIPVKLEQAYLVASSVIVAWQLSQLPEWSVWMLLLLLGFWDLFAVMTPIGPLRWLVDLVHEKGTPLPGLLFQADIVDAHGGSEARRATKGPPSSSDNCEQHETDDRRSHMVHSSTNVDDKRACALETKRCKGDSIKENDDEEDDKTIKLGLGDFIFYSVLAARAAMHGIEVFVPCFLCILVGLAITMHLLARFDALPALPISIFLGVLAYGLVSALVVPFIEHVVA